MCSRPRSARKLSRHRLVLGALGLVCIPHRHHDVRTTTQILKAWVSQSPSRSTRPPGHIDPQTRLAWVLGSGYRIHKRTHPFRPPSTVIALRQVRTRILGLALRADRTRPLHLIPTIDSIPGRSLPSRGRRPRTCNFAQPLALGLIPILKGRQLEGRQDEQPQLEEGMEAQVHHRHRTLHVLDVA
jgi:hypothetical protein